MIEYEYKDKNVNYYYNENAFYQLAEIAAKNECKSTNTIQYEIIKNKKYNEYRMSNMCANIMEKMEYETDWKLNKGLDINRNRTIRVMKYIPFEIYPNLIEWLKNIELSDIYYHELSLNLLIQEMNIPKEVYEKHKSNYIYEALWILSEYVKNNCIDKDIYINQAKRTYYKQ